MARKKQDDQLKMPAKQAVSLDLIPEVVPLKKTTKGNLKAMQQRVFLDHAEAMLQEIMQAMRIRIRRGDPKMIALGAEMHELVTGNKGPSVVANIVNSNSQRSVEVSSESVNREKFDSIVRRLDSRPTKISSDADFIDVSAAN